MSALLHEGDLRHVRVGDVELAQRVYVAVRDAVWNTIPGTISELEVSDLGESFHVSFSCVHRYEQIDFSWRSQIVGAADGTISYRMSGRPATTFSYAKIGLNVHHPLGECLGRPFRARTPAGELRGRLPTDIEPQLLRDGQLTALFDPYDELAIELEGGLEVRFRFEGDLFEMQDHRNWTDANLKSYGTPLSEPWPFDARPGEVLEQAVLMSFSGPAPSRRPRSHEVQVEVSAEAGPRLPAIGLGLGAGEPSGAALDLLRATWPAHLRVDLALADERCAERLADALETVRALGSRLELALFIEEGELPRLEALMPVLSQAGVPVSRVLVFAGGMGFSSTAGTTTPGDLVSEVRGRLRSALAGVPVAGGTNQFFNELNRHRPEAAAMDGVAYSINPQVHAADDMSLMENLGAQADTVRMAAKLGDGLPVFVGPVTLVGRAGPFPAGPPLPGEPPGNVDDRQRGLFCAAWTVASIGCLARAGAASITYFETAGPMGILPQADPGAAATEPQPVFPVYHVFADLAECVDARLLEARTSHSGEIAALAVVGAGRPQVLVANLTAQPRAVRLSGLDWTAGRMLDDASVSSAVSDASAYREAAPHAPPGDGRWRLGPYAFLRLVAGEDGQPG